MELQDMFIPPAKNASMYMVVSNKSKVVSCKFKDKYWFNDECRESKKEYMKYKRSVKHLGAKERSEILKQ